MADHPFANAGLGMFGADTAVAKQGMSGSDGTTGAMLLNSLFGLDLPTTQKGLTEYKTGLKESAIGSMTGNAPPAGAVAPVLPNLQTQTQPVAPVPPVTPNPAQPFQQQNQTMAPTVGVFRKFLDFKQEQ